MNKLLELVSDQNGTLSHTKLWSNVGLLIISCTYMFQVYKYGVTPDLMITYGGIVVTGRVASKYLDGKVQSVDIPQDNSCTTSTASVNTSDNN